MYIKGKYYQAYDNEIWLHTSHRRINKKLWVGEEIPKVSHFIIKLPHNRFIREWIITEINLPVTEINLPVNLELKTVLMHQWKTQKSLKFLKGALKQLALE